MDIGFAQWKAANCTGCDGDAIWVIFIGVDILYSWGATAAAVAVPAPGCRMCESLLELDTTILKEFGGDSPVVDKEVVDPVFDKTCRAGTSSELAAGKAETGSARTLSAVP